MKKFIANRIVKNEINCIIGILDEKNLTYTEKWYFNGIIYREEKRYSRDSEQAKYEFDLACKIYAEKCNLIHEEQ